MIDIADAAVEIDASINDSITEDITDKDLSINKDGGSAKEVCKSHKKKEDGSAKKSSGKRKKERHSGPMAKKHKVDSDSSPPLVVPTVEGDEAPPLVVPTVEGDEDSMDTMQTRMRTGTISKVQSAILLVQFSHITNTKLTIINVYKVM